MIPNNQTDIEIIYSKGDDGNIKVTRITKNTQKQEIKKESLLTQLEQNLSDATKQSKEKIEKIQAQIDEVKAL